MAVINVCQYVILKYWDMRIMDLNLCLNSVRFTIRIIILRTKFIRNSWTIHKFH